MSATPNSTAARAELDFLGSRVQILVDGAETEGRFSLLDMIEVPPGHMPPLHVHRDHEEGFLVLEGEVTLFLPGEEMHLGPGDFLLAPRGVPHAYRVGDRPARWLIVTSPAGFERFVSDVAALEAPAPGRLAAIAAEYGVDILGAPGELP
jgi:quercetin dioxygenase-like cupin family protein